MCNVKTQVTMVIARKTGTLSKSSKKISVKRTGKAVHQEIQKTVILGTKGTKCLKLKIALHVSEILTIGQKQ
jgi:hypothetical protein